MGRRTVQMARMRMGVPSSATHQVGAILLSPVQLGHPVPGLLAASFWDRVLVKSVSWALMLVM